MAIEESVPSCDVIIVPTPLHKYTQNIQTHTYIQISILRKTNTSTCSHIQLHAQHTCMHVCTSKTYTCIYTHIMMVTPKVQKIYPTYILASLLNLVCLGHLLCTKYRTNTYMIERYLGEFYYSVCISVSHHQTSCWGR